MAKYQALPPHRDKPLLILGISGVVVLDAAPTVPTTTWHVSAWGKWVRDVVVPDDAAERIRALSERFEIVWASEWGHNAHTAFRHVLGLPEEPWPFLPVQFDKLEAIRAYAGDLPWVWVDDPVVDLSGEVGPDVGGVVVRVDPSRGIDDVEAEPLLARLERVRTESEG